MLLGLEFAYGNKEDWHCTLSEEMQSKYKPRDVCEEEKGRGGTEG